MVKTLWVRVCRYHFPADRAEEGWEEFLKTVEVLRKAPGVHRATFFIDRENNAALSMTYWKDKEALEASEETGLWLRTMALAAVGGETISVDRFSVIYDEHYSDEPLIEEEI